MKDDRKLKILYTNDDSIRNKIKTCFFTADELRVDIIFITDNKLIYYN
jgi:hypothetical protein